MGYIARSLQLHGRLPAATAQTIEEAMAEIINVEYDDSDDIDGPGPATVGFKLTGYDRRPLALQTVIQFNAYTDQYKSIPATPPATPEAKLQDASKGTILNGSGGAGLTVMTDANGEFECDLYLTGGPLPQTVWVGCENTGGRVIDCSGADSVTFSPVP